MENQIDDDKIRKEKWARRKEEMRRRKRRQELFRRYYIYGVALITVIILVAVFAGIRNRKEKPQGEETEKGAAGTQEEIDDAQEEATDKAEEKSILAVGAGVRIDRFVEIIEEKERREEELQEESSPKEYVVTEATKQLGSDIVSGHAIFVDTLSGKILARKDEESRIVPASMTKVLTLLVAVEHIDNLDDRVEITRDIADYCLINDCSNAGFSVGEKVTVRDLLYATILPSGADGALGLANYVAGSQEAFVDLMNAKLEELGLSDTAHFTNCVGIYEDNHYCTLSDMAYIMETAMKNEICKEVMSAHTYLTSLTEEHPEGIALSNWFLRRIEDKEGGEGVLSGKTGYVAQSEHCAVSYGMTKSGREYICVTTNASGKWRCIEDHAYLYQMFSD